jgi:hypothetical protein
MAKFKCEKCCQVLILDKHTMKIVDGKIVVPEAICCDTYMESIKENKGFGCAMVGKGGKVRGKF